MNISVLFFASLKEDLGFEKIDLSISGEPDRESLLLELENHLGKELASPLRQNDVAIAVNQTIESGDFQLQMGDEVAFLPPITGG